MGFLPIMIDKYVEKHLKSNPTENKKDLRNRLNSALLAYKNGERCTCGNDLWVIGSATVGNSCFTCITGESNPTDDYEIDTAIKKEKVQKDVDILTKLIKHKFLDFSMTMDSRLIPI